MSDPLQRYWSEPAAKPPAPPPDPRISINRKIVAAIRRAIAYDPSDVEIVAEYERVKAEVLALNRQLVRADKERRAKD